MVLSDQLSITQAYVVFYLNKDVFTTLFSFPHGNGDGLLKKKHYSRGELIIKPLSVN